MPRIILRYPPNKVIFIGKPYGYGFGRSLKNKGQICYISITYAIAAPSFSDLVIACTLCEIYKVSRDKRYTGIAYACNVVLRIIT